MTPPAADGANPSPGTLPGKRLFPRASLLLLLLLVIGAAHLFLVTYGTWTLLAPELRSDAYDSLGDHLLRFEANLEPETVNWEGLDIRGKKYMYWGPFPAMLRIPLNLVWPQAWGQWARVSSLAASLLCVLAFCVMLQLALEENLRLSRRAKDLLLVLFGLAWGLGTPLLYLVSSGRIYHESIIWALSSAAWALLGALAHIRGWLRPPLALAIASTGAGVSLLSRVTFGVPLYAILALLVGVQLWRNARADSTRVGLRALALALAPAAMMLGVQAWYNFDRFGSVLTFMDYDYCYLNPEKTMEGVLNLRRLPVLASNYLGFRSAQFLSDPPFVQMATVDYYGRTFFNHDWKEQTVSLLVASPWLVLGALSGTLGLLKGRRWSTLLVSLALLSEVVLILSFWSASQRYAAEFLPWLLLSFVCFVADGLVLSFRKGLVLAALVAVSITATVSSTLSWHAFYASPDVDVPRAWQGRLLTWFRVVPPIPSWAGKRVYLDTLEPRDISSSYAAPEFAWPSRTKQTWGPAEFEHAVFAHAQARIRFDVPPGATAIESLLSLAETGRNCQSASLRFRILGDDDALLYESDLFTSAGAPLADGSVAPKTSRPCFVRVPLHGASQVTLAVDDGGNGIDCDHGSFFMPAFLIPEGR